MAEIFKQWAPNVWAYRAKFVSSCEATVQMFVTAGGIAFVLGALFGVVLAVTRRDGIRPSAVVFRAVDTFVNVFRSIPFIILLIFLIPLTRALTGTAIGVKGAIVPLVFGAVPFYARQVESVLVGVDPGKIEAARSMGSGTAGIVFRVCLPEAVPGLIRATTITALSLIGLTTMAGAVGAGGIGSFAINYGQNLHHQDIVNVCVAALLTVVSLLQCLGSFLASRATNRRLLPSRRRLRRDGGAKRP